MHICFFSVHSAVVQLWLWHNMQESVPVVSHKFKSGLSVSKELDGIECSQWGVALVLFLRWNISPIRPCTGTHTVCTGLNANFSFRQRSYFIPPGECLHLRGWMGSTIAARSLHSGWPVIHLTATAFKHGMHVCWYKNKCISIFIHQCVTALIYL